MRRPPSSHRFENCSGTDDFFSRELFAATGEIFGRPCPRYRFESARATRAAPVERRCWIGAVVAVGLGLAWASSASAGDRVAVLLDNSGSMSAAGTPFAEIKQSLIEAVMVLPPSAEIGLRVFSDEGTRLVAPYGRNIDGLRGSLDSIEPAGGTYIGQALVDAARDLAESDHAGRIVLITDGLGSSQDIELARKARSLLEGKKYGCTFILFSLDKERIESTYVAAVAAELGCSKLVSSQHPTAAALSSALMSAFAGVGFQPVWILLSCLLYLLLLLLTSQLLFHAQAAAGVLPRRARLRSLVFLLPSFPLVITIHILAVVLPSSSLGPLAWSLLGLAGALLLLAFHSARSRRMRTLQGEEDAMHQRDQRDL